MFELAIWNIICYNSTQNSHTGRVEGSQSGKLFPFSPWQELSARLSQLIVLASSHPRQATTTGRHHTPSREKSVPQWSGDQYFVSLADDAVLFCPWSLEEIRNSDKDDYSSLPSSVFVNRKKRRTMDPNLVRPTVPASQHRGVLHRGSPCLSQHLHFILSSAHQLRNNN